MKRKKKSMKRIVLLSISLLLFLAIAFTLFVTLVRKDIGFRIQTDFRSVFATNPLEQAEPDTTIILYHDLLTDSRVTQNQSLLLINQEYRLTDAFQPELGGYRGTDVKLNTCLHDAYGAISAKVQELYGQTLYIRSAYRTAEEQMEELSENDKLAAQVGASEHQAGLAMDVYVPYFAGMAFLKTETGRYVNEHCGEFGFIIRYPSYGQASTKIDYEPWHLRYVGLPHAEIIMDSCTTLEQYIAGLELNQFYRYGDYLITRQSGESLRIPKSFQSAVVSEDNTGAYILTFRVAPFYA